MKRVRWAVFLLVAAALGPADPAAVEDGPTHSGVEIAIDLPASRQIHNIGAPEDGLGLCVFASMEHAGRWHNRRPLFDVINKIPKGGGWPEKVDAVLKEHAPDVRADHHYIKTKADLGWVRDELHAGKMICITYGYGERYSNQTIYHMVNLVHLDEKWAVFLDNNFPCTPERPNRYEWMSADEGFRRIIHPTGQGWAYSLDAPPPPPVPHN